MADQKVLRVRLTLAAKRDFTSIIRWSFRKFGEEAAFRYEALLMQAFEDLATDPERFGSRTHPELMIADARIYHLSFSRFHVEATGVKRPRHMLLYRLDKTGMVKVARILHDSRDLQKHLPSSYRRI